MMASAFIIQATSAHPPSRAPPKSPARPRKPHGYWANPATLSAELHRFRTQDAAPPIMPTAGELLSAGRIDLYRAVQRHGGFAAAAVRGGLVRRPRARAQPAVAAPAARGRPRAEMTVAAPSAAETASLPTRRTRRYDRQGRTARRARGYWREWRVLEVELRAFAYAHCGGCMPLQRELRAEGRSDLLNAVRTHGGVVRVARRAGLLPPPSVATKRPRGHWAEPHVLHAELLTFTAKYGHPGLMPRREQLLRAGRADLHYAIEKYAGYMAVAAELHLVWHGPCSYWRMFRNVQKRLLAFVRKRGKEVMPSVQTMQEWGRMDLVYGVAMHGGVMVVAKRIGLPVVFPRRDVSYWGDPANVQRELEDIIQIQPLEARHCMPTSVALVQAGRADLATAIRDHGGWVYYAQRLGLRFNFEVRQQGFWQLGTNVLGELRNYVSLRYGTWEHPGKPPSEEELAAGRGLNTGKGRKSGDGTADDGAWARYIPSSEMLARDGRSDIAFAIERYHGGIEAFAAQHKLMVAEDVVQVRPAEVLMRWTAFAQELQLWMRKHGANGIMPTKHDLIRTGRHDLRYAMYKHGGSLRVSQRLQLVVAEAALDAWLPQWLGMQAGKMGLAVGLSENEKAGKLTTGGAQVLRGLEAQLNGWVLGEERCLVEGVELLAKGRVRRGGIGMGIERGFRKISVEELNRIRGKYKHLPPDDIITV